MRICTKCKKNKPLTCFYKQRGGKSGHRALCKKCSEAGKRAYEVRCPEKVTESRRKTYLKYRDQRLEKSRAWSHTLKGRYSSYRKGAHQRDLIFELTLNNFAQLTSQYCAYCGQLPEQNYVGVDRIENDRGYSLENCVPCCGFCNYVKSSLSVKELQKHISKVHERINNESFEIQSYKITE